MAIRVVERVHSGTKSSCKTPCSSSQRRVKHIAGTCVGILFCTVTVLFVLVSSLHPSEDPRSLVTFRYRIRNHALLASYTDATVACELVDKAESFAALEGLGTLFRKGRNAMPELVVAYLSVTTTPEDLRFFLRGLHRSGMPARADVVLLFPWRPLPQEIVEVIQDEENYFQRLLATKSTSANEAATLSVFNLGAYTRAMPHSGSQESVWGKKKKSGSNGSSRVKGWMAPHFGAVVGFDVQELDPDDTLSGFLDSSPAVLRRWTCYQILLGMVHRRYRHVLLTEVTGVFILNDVLAGLERKDTSLHLFNTGHRWSDSITAQSKPQIPFMESIYGKSLDASDRMRMVISTGLIMGSSRQVRTLATAMATEIVRVAILRNSRTPFHSDSPLLSFLVHKSSVFGKKVATHLKIHESGTSAINFLPGSRFEDVFRRSDHSRFSVLQGLKNDGVSTEKIMTSLRRDMCRSHRDIAIYGDCNMTIAKRVS